MPVFGQQKSTLTLVYPKDFAYDTVLVSNEARSVLKETSKTYKGEEIISTYTFHKSPNHELFFSIYFGGEFVNIRDTLYFNGRGKNMKVEIGNSFELRENYPLIMDNCYNFEELFQRYSQRLDSMTNNYDATYVNKSIDGYSITDYKEEFTLNFIKENLENPNAVYLLSMFIINRLNYPNYDRIILFYEEVLKPTIKEPGLRNWIEIRIENINDLKEGKTAPSFSTRTYDGIYLNSDSLRGKNILLTFWATWCPPCIEEFPWLREINDRFKNEDLVMISVSVDNHKDSVKAVNMINKENLHWLHVINDERIKKAFQINPIPMIILINAEGVIEFNSLQRSDKPRLKGLNEILAKNITFKENDE